MYGVSVALARYSPSYENESEFIDVLRQRFKAEVWQHQLDVTLTLQWTWFLRKAIRADQKS